MKPFCKLAHPHLLLLFLVACSHSALAFMVTPLPLRQVISTTRSATSSKSTRRPSQLNAAAREEDDIDRELAKARILLIEAKKQIAAMDAGEEYVRPVEVTTHDETTTNVPFFAKLNEDSNSHAPSKREIVIKSRNEDGLITVNGEEMAKLSEEEMWSARPLDQVFENELNEDEDVYALATESLRQRDVAASIFNLRKSMQPQDYQKIFDKKNYFIGEDV